MQVSASVGVLAVYEWEARLPVAPVGCCHLGANWIALDPGCRLFRNTTELEKLSELGVLFLLFEMGLELSFDRLKVGRHPCLQSLLRSEVACCVHCSSENAPGSRSLFAEWWFSPFIPHHCQSLLHNIAKALQAAVSELTFCLVTRLPREARAFC